MRVLAIVSDTGAYTGLIGTQIVASGGHYDTFLPYADNYYSSNGKTMPEQHHGYSGLLIMGGLMDAFDDAGYPELQAIVGLIQQFHEADKPVLGVCLGAQLIARAFAGKVYRHTVAEIGFSEVTMTTAAETDPLLRELGRRQTLMQWHQDTFELPTQAQLLMSNSICRNQAMRIGRATYGFQCHFEVTTDIVRHWIQSGRDHLTQYHPHVLATIEAQLRTNSYAAQLFGETISRRWFELMR